MLLIFQNSQKVTRCLGHFGKKICHQDLSKIAKSDHAVYQREREAFILVHDKEQITFRKLASVC